MHVIHLSPSSILLRRFRVLKKYSVSVVALHCPEKSATVDTCEKYGQDLVLVCSSGCNDFTSILQSMILKEKNRAALSFTDLKALDFLSRIKPVEQRMINSEITKSPNLPRCECV